MSGAILYIAAAMFGIPLVIMLLIAITGSDIPSPILFWGGWAMAFGLIVGGVGAFIALNDG